MISIRRMNRVLGAAVFPVFATVALAQPSYNLATIGLTGSPYSYAYQGGIFESSSFADLDSSAQMVGATFRYNSSGNSLGSDAWLYSNGSIQQVGLTGAGYSYTYAGTGGGTYENSSYALAGGMNSRGDFPGTSNRYNSSGGSLGQDAWLYIGGTVKTIALTGSAYSYIYAGTGGGAYQFSAAYGINETDETAGLSRRYNSAGTQIGQDLWFYNGATTTQIGLTGSAYSYTYAGSGGGTYESSSISNANAVGPLASGAVTGTTNRYNSGGTQVGNDAWFYNGTTQQVGLTGANYSYAYPTGGTYQKTSITSMNASGATDGVSFRYNSAGNSLGQDAWVYNNGVTQQIGFTGGPYQYTYGGTGGGTYQSSSIVGINLNGQVCGYSTRYAYSISNGGQDAWIVTGSTIKQMGLVGAGYTSTGGYESSTIASRNEAGEECGYSARCSANGGINGNDAWVFDGNTTREIGLTGAGYSYTAGGNTTESCQSVSMNSTGQVCGTSSRYGNSGSTLGMDSWVYTGSTTLEAGLSGPGYSYTTTGTGGGTYQSSTPLGINNIGDAYGTASRMDASGNSLGKAGWFFDPRTDVTSPLAFSFRSSDNYSTTTPQILTDTGDVLGTYELYSGTTDEGVREFYWDETSGFHDLGSLVNGGLTSAGWQYFNSAAMLGYAPDGSPLYIVSKGTQINQTGGTSLAILADTNTLAIGIDHSITAASDAQIGTAGYGIALFGGTLSVTSSFNTTRPIAVNNTGATINVAGGANFGIGGGGALGWFAGTLTVNGAGTLNIAQTGNAVRVIPGSALYISPASTLTLSGTVDPLTDSTSPSLHVTVVNDGSLNVNQNCTLTNVTGAGALTIARNAVAADVAQGSLTINGTLSLLPSGNTNTLNSLTIHAGGKLDLANDSMIINDTGAALDAGIRSDLVAGYQAGAWNGSGIVSSASAANANHSTTLGYLDNGTLLQIKYTWVGDANLDGIVNSADYSAISASGTTWATGDFNYDGAVNADDYALFMLGATFGSTNISALLPEPTGIIAGIAMILSLPYRRRNFSSGESSTENFHA